MTPPEPTTPMFILFTRAFWMMLGPMILGMLTFTIIDMGTSWFTPADFTFLAVLCGLLLARWLEFQSGDPRTAMGEPASPRHLRKYVLVTIALGLGVWVFANLLGNHWLMR